ncbi:MAG: hypothetical protein IKK30_02570, partial [Clostridia bacterium]|nr:hypothetical protein [Clostridia bacterium]
QKANRKYTKSLWAILLPVLYCVLDSLGTFVDTLIAEGYVERIGNEDLAGDVMNTAYELTWMIIAIAFAIYVFGIKKEKINKKFDGVKLLGGTCETVGQIFYAKVVVSGYIPGLVIISSYCLVSMVWSAIFLKEKLSWKHYLCLAAAILGILVLGYFDV